RPRNFRPVQSSGDSHLDTLCAESLSILDRASHCAPEGNSFFELLCNLLGLQLGIEFRLVDLLNVYINLAPGSVLDLQLQLVDLGAFAANNNAGPRSVNDDL